MPKTIYIVEDSHGDLMGQRFTTDAEGVEAIVREYYRKTFLSVLIRVAVDMENLTVTVTRFGYRKTYLILPLKGMQ